MREIVEEQMTREHRTEAPATNDDEVKGPCIGVADRVCARRRLVEAVAHVPAENINREIRSLRSRVGHG